MYIDDGTAGDSGELNINVDGHEYIEQENYSFDQNGIVDSVAVDTADGGHIVYSDTDHTGIADTVTEYDQQGDELQQAHYDASTGHWIDLHPDSAGTSGTSTQTNTDAGDSGGTGETITVATANGQVNIGPATVDTNNDGRPDTAVVHDANGDTILYTDGNADGQADIATEITPDGQVVIADHTGGPDWTEVEHGHLSSDGQYTNDSTASGPFTPTVGSDAAPVRDVAADEHWGASPSDWATAFNRGFSETGSAQGVVRIDATTGQWISQN